MTARILFFLIAIFLAASCSYTIKIKDGNTAFEQKQYKTAIPLLKKEYGKTKSKVEQGEIAFLIGECYRFMNKNEESISWYRTAYDYNYGMDALKQYAYALKQNQQYKEAIRAFKDLGIELGSPYEYRKEITACNIAMEWEKDKNKSPYEVNILDVSTSAADYSPMLYEDNYLVFTSDRSTSTGEEIYNWTGNNFSDLFKLDLKTKAIEPFEGPFNTTDNEGTVAFNNDYTEVYFTRCFSNSDEDAYCKILMSRRDGNSWSNPVKLNFIKEEINYGHPSLSSDGSVLYFSSNDPEGWGGYDIYYSEKTPDGWSTPKLMSRSINTPQDEKFPYIDNDTLYFASNGHTGMGGLDIFRSFRQGSDYWSPAFNLKAPINSASDDFGFVVDDRPMAYEDPDLLRVGYFSSSRKDGAGNDDLYAFEKRTPPPEPEKDSLEQAPIVYKILLEGFVLEKIYRDPNDPNSEVLGRKPLPGSKVKVSFGEEEMVMEVGEDGMFKMELDEDTDYSFFGSRKGYLSNSTFFSTRGIGKDPQNPVVTFNIEIVLDKIFLDKEIVLENIYYDFDKSFIRDDAKPSLDNLTQVLNQNPDIRIQLSSHTDCRGSNSYNEELSQRRAQAAVDYLISKGINTERLVAKGYGENIPANDCNCGACTEEEHQENRRTTFKIIE